MFFNIASNSAFKGLRFKLFIFTFTFDNTYGMTSGKETIIYILIFTISLYKSYIAMLST